jgi:hypothetical protein
LQTRIKETTEEDWINYAVRISDYVDRKPKETVLHFIDKVAQERKDEKNCQPLILDWPAINFWKKQDDGHENRGHRQVKNLGVRIDIHFFSTH